MYSKSGATLNARGVFGFAPRGTLLLKHGREFLPVAEIPTQFVRALLTHGFNNELLVFLRLHVAGHPARSGSIASHGHRQENQ